METGKLSISFRVDSGVVEHNTQKFTAKNVDAARTSDNVVYVQRDLREVYRELFDDALQKYNARKRSNERINNYYAHIKNSKQEKPFYEAVVQFGDVNTCGLNSDNWETARTLLDEYMKTFQSRNPNMVVVGAYLHLDEATPHLHIDFIPVCHNQTRGLETRELLEVRGEMLEVRLQSTLPTATIINACCARTSAAMGEVMRRFAAPF